MSFSITGFLFLVLAESGFMKALRTLRILLKIFYLLLYIGSITAAGYVLVDYLEMKSRESTKPVTYVFVSEDKKAYPLYEGETLQVKNATILAVKSDGNISKVYVESSLESKRDAQKK